MNLRPPQVSPDERDFDFDYDAVRSVFRSVFGVWVPEGSLAGFLLGRFLGSGRPLGALIASKNVGGEAPHIFGWF